MPRLRRDLVRSAPCLFALGIAWAAEALADAPAEAIYARATNQFPAAVFLKPAEATNPALPFQLAPLIIQEVPHDDHPTAPPANAFPPPASERDLPASAWAVLQAATASPGASDHVAAAGTSRPAVFYAMDSVDLNGRSHARLSYQWCYPPRTAVGRPPAPSRQGLRITIDSRAQPAIWEVLTDSSGLRLIFVAQSVDAAAAAQFGKPLPGRRYSIERGLDEAPDVVVARVIDDGPIPMGPILYLSSGTRDVSTLICRCMPAQVKRLVATRTFDLAPFDSTAMTAYLRHGRAGTNAPPVLWFREGPAGNPLAQRLRLPAGF